MIRGSLHDLKLGKALLHLTHSKKKKRKNIYKMDLFRVKNFFSEKDLMWRVKYCRLGENFCRPYILPRILSKI